MTDRDIDLHYLRIGAKILDKQEQEWVEKNKPVTAKETPITERTLTNAGFIQVEQYLYQRGRVRVEICDTGCVWVAGFVMGEIWSKNPKLNIGNPTIEGLLRLL